MARKNRTDSPASSVPEVTGTYRIVPIDEVRPNTFNYNTQSAFIQDKMVESMVEDGFISPMEVRSGNEKGAFGYYEIIGGEHRLKTARKLGLKQVPVIDLGHFPDLRAKKLCIKLNETKGKPSTDRLASLLAEIQDEGGAEALASMPFAESELGSLLAMASEAELPEDPDDPEDEDAEESRKERKPTLAAAMGLLDMKRAREEILMRSWEELMEASGTRERPLHVLETVIKMGIQRYGCA